VAAPLNPPGGLLNGWSSTSSIIDSAAATACFESSGSALPAVAVLITSTTPTSAIASTMMRSKSSGKVKPRARRARSRVHIAGDRFDREIARDVAGDREGDIRSHVQAAERREPKRGVRRGDGDASRGGAREARLALRRWHRYRARARRIGAIAEIVLPETETVTFRR